MPAHKQKYMPNSSSVMKGIYLDYKLDFFFFFFTGQHLKQHAIYSRNRLGGKWDFLLLKEFHNCFLCHFHSYHCVTLVCKPATICTVHFNHVVNFFVNFQAMSTEELLYSGSPWKQSSWECQNRRFWAGNHSSTSSQSEWECQNRRLWAAKHLQPIRVRMSEQKALGCQSFKQLQPIRMPQIIFCMKSQKTGHHAWPKASP